MAAATPISCGLTFELTGKRQPAARMQNKKTAAARPAVGFPVERMVRALSQVGVVHK